MKELVIEADRSNTSQVQTFIDEQLEEVDCPLMTQTAIDIAVEELFVKESLNKSRLTAQHSSRLHLFRHLAPNSLENRQVSCAHLIQSLEKSDCAI